MFTSNRAKRWLQTTTASLCFCSPWVLADAATQEQGQLPLKELRTFANVYNQIREAYVEEIDDSTLLEFAVQGMLMGLDPHSVYLTKDGFSDLQDNTSGEFSGLGIEVGVSDGYITIISPIDGSPAEEAGLQPGDVILKLDDVSVKDVNLSKAIEQMRGPEGTTIDLLIGRPGTSQPFDVTLTRAPIKVASVRERWLEPGYGYLRISQFQQRSGQDMEKAIARLLEKDELKGLVLDLRNNPGGVLRASVEVTSAFLDGGTVVYTEGRLQEEKTVFSAQAGDSTANTPLVVLINGGSASASEIVAGALQDHKRAVIMGTQSFGKGSVQTILPLPDERAIKLTTALYFTPDGRSIQAEGIQPDIVVERAKLTAYRGSNAQLSEANLSGHLDNSNEDNDEPAEDAKALQAAATELLSTDNQLYEALILLKGLNILGQRGSTAATSG